LPLNSEAHLAYKPDISRGEQSGSTSRTAVVRPSGCGRSNREVDMGQTDQVKPKGIHCGTKRSVQ